MEGKPAPELDDSSATYRPQTGANVGYSAASYPNPATIANPNSVTVEAPFSPASADRGSAAAYQQPSYGHLGGGQGTPNAPPSGQYGTPGYGGQRPDPASVQLGSAMHRSRPWHFSLCECCTECDSCLESWCCMYCQLSRQCNMMLDNKPQIHWPYCLLISCTDICLGLTIISCIFVMQTRQMARNRYGISGGGCGDCCVGWCCRPCGTQQVLLEMTTMNDFPGATCYSAVPHPVDFEMV